MMRWIKENYFNFAFFIVAIFSLYYIYKNVNIETQLNTNTTETVGKIVGYSGAGGGKNFAVYQYYVNKKKFKGSGHIGDDNPAILNSYYSVRYSNENPQTSKIDLSKQIFDSLRIANAGFSITK